MHVSAFWSYSREGRGVQLRNSITGGTVDCPPAVLDLLESVAASGEAPVASDPALLEALFESNILFSSREDAERWFDARDRAATLALPRIDQIELTNRCPYRCKMCPRTTHMTRALGDMDLELFTRIAEQIAPPHQYYVALHHFGESLVYRNLPEAVERAAALGLRTGLSCNPPSLKPRIAERLLHAGIASILLSLDSLDAATYRAIRGPAANLARALDHVATLVRLRDAGRYSTSITVQFIQMSDNSGEAEAFLAWARDVGVDRAVVVRLGRWDFDDSRVSELGRFDTPLHGDYCRRPWNSVVVMWDGRVVPCCHDYNGEVVLGDLREQTLADLWASERAQAFRRQAHRSALCASCAFSKPFRESSRDSGSFRRFHCCPPQGAPLEYVKDPPVGTFDFNGFDVATA